MSPRPPLRRPAPRRARALGLALALLLACAPALAPRAADDVPVQEQIRGTRAQLKQLRHEREQLKSNLERYQSKAETTVTELDSLVQLVRDSKHRERQLLNMRQKLLRERKSRSRRMDDIRDGIAGAEARIRANLRNIYRLSKVEEAASLLVLAQHKSYFKDVAYFSRLTRLDREALQRYRVLTGELADAQAEAQRALQEQAAVMETLVAEQAQLLESERALRNALVDLRRDQKLSKAYLEELDQSMTGMETTLAKLEAEPPPEQRVNRLPEPAALKGQLPAPAEGTVIAAFGRQDPRYALKKFTRGIVIRVAEGTDVHAVAAGKVVHAGPFRGYQDLVVLDHGHGLYTVYGHLENVKLARNSFVEAGALLGQATYQPIDQRYGVYFEVRLHGVPQDPLAWIQSGRLALADSATQD